ncbi:MAG TPA: hypothetical protein VHQ02_08845 [Usitatibacter sp.]|jgi:hypothetical protein|nr:hypothetical protein [Usitatibacter sp.]
MNARIVAFFAALLVIVAAAYLLGKPVDPSELRPGASASAGSSAAKPPLTARGFPLALARPGGANTPLVHPHVAARPSLYNEYLAARSYRALYDRLHGSPEGATGEGLYVMYDILRECATVTDRPYRRGPNVKPVDQRRQEFLAALAPDDPQRDKRIAAFETTAVDHCQGFEGLTVTQADLDKMLGQAADAGDPKAKAASVESQIWAERRAGQWRTATLSESQISTLEDAIGTKDPAAMMTAGRLLSNTWPDISMHVGTDGNAVEPRAFYNAWQVLACEYGYPCGSDTPQLLQACAYNSHCDAQTLPEYLYYYSSSPHDAQLVAQYESVLRTAIEKGDWSQLTVTRGPNMPGATRYMFGHGPG